MVHPITRSGISLKDMIRLLLVLAGWVNPSGHFFFSSELFIRSTVFTSFPRTLQQEAPVAVLRMKGFGPSIDKVHETNLCTRGYTPLWSSDSGREWSA